MSGERRTRTGDAQGAGGRTSLCPCPLCGRPMVEGGSVDRHHLVPRSRGGRTSLPLHRICHRKLHSIWTEAELARAGGDLAVLRAHPEIERFVAWVAGRPAEFWAPTDRRHRPGRRR